MKAIKIYRYRRFFRDRITFLIHRRRVRTCRQIVYHILQRANEEIKYKEKLKSILHIQAASRALFQRIKLDRQYKVLKEKVHRFHYLKACLLLQKTYRGFRIRKRFRVLITATKKIQSFMRTRWLRSYFLNLRTQVVKIQRIFRQYRLRRIKNKEMLWQMMDKIENVSGFQVIENALLYGLDQKTTLQYVFEISRGSRKDFIAILNERENLRQVSRFKTRSKSRERSRSANKRKKGLYQEMQKEGIVAVGDISNKTDTAATKSTSPIKYYTFVEMFDFLIDIVPAPSTTANAKRASKSSNVREGVTAVTGMNATNHAAQAMDASAPITVGQAAAQLEMLKNLVQLQQQQQSHRNDDHSFSFSW